ncbi:MAG: rod shape-determining protein MreD [Candidatus Omnitrophota bacterium]|jgi:rod shape-determining protein MreD
MMNKRLRIYGLLLLATVIQAAGMKYTPWFPDLIILMVVYTGIFHGSGEGIRLGIAAGILRGSLSLYTLPVDIFLFPAVGALSAVLAERVYRQNPVVEVVITVFALFTVIAFHTFYLKIVSGNELLGLWNSFSGSLRVISVTAAISPLFYFLLRGSREQEE